MAFSIHDTMFESGGRIRWFISGIHIGSLLFAQAFTAKALMRMLEFKM